MSYYPVYTYKNNGGVPMTSSQIQKVLSNPQTKIIDGISGNVMQAPPKPGVMRPDGKPYHVANYIPQTHEMVYHGISRSNNHPSLFGRFR